MKCISCRFLRACRLIPAYDLKQFYDALASFFLGIAASK
jgi:hypothetical protein